MATIGELQRSFSLAAAELIIEAYRRGYEVSLGDAYRDPRVHGEVGEKKGYGRSRSLHKLRLAIDLNLFKDGRYLSATEDHRELGEWWEAKYPGTATWGGHFNDGNHYSFTYNGMQ